MKNIFLTLLTLIFVACAGSEKNDSAKVSESWAGNMQATAKSFQELLPYIYDGDKFSAKKNRASIAEKISSYKKNIHKIDLKKAKDILGDDPYVLASIKNLRDLTDRAEQSFKRGDNKNSRILLKATTNTCFKCHTRQDMGPKGIHWKNFQVSSIKTNSVEKAHLLVSMRQYEDAKLQLKAFLSKSEDLGKFDLLYENALHYYLMISLRGQKTFKSTLNFLKSKILVVKTPTELHYTLKHWEQDLSYLIKNKSKLSPTLESADWVLKRNKKAYSERNLINDLVASSLLHDFFMKEKSQKKRASAYLMLGKIYDELIVEGFWDLPEIYYEKCIDYAPKSKTAVSCYKKIKNNVTIGYSGSRGTMIPAAEYQRLEVLRKKAGL